MEWLFLHKLLSQHKWSLRKNSSMEKISIRSGLLIGKSFQNPTSGMCFQNIWGCETPTILRHFWPQYWLFLTQMLTFWTLTFIDFLAPNRPNYWVRLISTFPPFDLNSKMIVFSRAVGWEGFFGAIMLSILLVPFYYIILPPAFCADAVEPALNGSCRLEGRSTVIKNFSKTGKIWAEIRQPNSTQNLYPDPYQIFRRNWWSLSNGKQSVDCCSCYW